ncbi:MAG: hypothetical protein KAG04_01535 [Mycoplasmataceae bacterium]|nr:hypothetical protein [Mycoplasmataceae bacterium]
MKVKTNLLIGLSIFKMVLFTIFISWIVVFVNTTLVKTNWAQTDALMYLIFIIGTSAIAFLLVVTWIATIVIAYRLKDAKNIMLWSIFCFSGVATLVTTIKYIKTTK